LQALCLEDWAAVLVTYSACVGGVTASTALEASVIEIELGDGAAALADEERARAVMSSEAGTAPTQRDDLNISAVVICLDVLQRDDETFYKRVSERCFQQVSFMPIVLAGKYIPAA
jgi:hypothetical protein